MLSRHYYMSLETKGYQNRLEAADTLLKEKILSGQGVLLTPILLLLRSFL